MHPVELVWDVAPGAGCLDLGDARHEEACELLVRMERPAPFSRGCVDHLPSYGRGHNRKEPTGAHSCSPLRGVSRVGRP